MKDLRPDLLGDHLAVRGDAARRRRLDPVLQAQERGVLGGHAQAAPPEHRPVLDQVVAPVQPICAGRQSGIVPVVGQGAQERERPRRCRRR
jgi:hypothetical protein